MFQEPHTALPKATHDEAARQDFAATMRKRFTTQLWPANRMLFEEQLVPKFREKHGRDPENEAEARAPA